MADFFLYILKWAVVLTLLYSFYGLWLRRETFHTLNRMVLLGILLTSVLLPAFHITTTQSTPLNQGVERVEILMLEEDVLPPVWNRDVEKGTAPVLKDAEVAATTPFSWIRLTFIIYLLGMLVCWLHYLYKLCRFSILVFRSRPLPAPDVPTWVRVSVSTEVRNSCSWFRWIVLAPADVHDARATILIHELAHIRRGHSWDKLLCECTCRMLWFLPFAWMLRQDLADVHEFEADRAVLGTGVNLKEYNELLIRNAVRTGLQPVGNAFNESKTKKRMVMMFKKKSAKLVALKALYLLPLIAFAVTAFAKPQIADEIEETITQTPLDILPQAEAAQAVSGLNDLTPEKPNAENLVPDDTLNATHQEVTNVLLVINNNPVNLDERGKLAPLYADAQEGGQAAVTLSIIRTWHGEECAQMANIDTANIKEIRILTEVPGSVIWGENGRNGVIEIQTKDICDRYQTLRAGDVIFGKVWSEEDSASFVLLENAKVCEVIEGGHVVGKPVITDKKGHFRMQITNPANKIRISRDGYSDLISSIRNRYAYYQIYRKDYFTVKAGDIVTGEARDGSETLPDVYIAEIDGVGNVINYTKTDASGKFSLRISDPKHRLEGRKENYTAQSAPIHKGNNRIFMDSVFPGQLENIQGLGMDGGLLTINGQIVQKIVLEDDVYTVFPPPVQSSEAAPASPEEFEGLIPFPANFER
ncbi:MAG: M56 family metallopeptidase [Bacteroidaceae bacterium]|nr:M56 family metallopeptidase [Bacteroidaceae bacterium]